jgi:DNA-binding MarR family transcriptional regulator
MACMSEPTWGFLTNHAYVLRCLAGSPELTMREVAERIGITERAVQRIVSELEEGGYLVRAKEGRRNRYLVREGRRRRELDAALPLRELLGLNDGSPRVAAPRSDPADSVSRNRSFID